ncbi:MAG: NAD(P)-dependent oxidoreductase [Oligoflexia bacterium]|nr:NAD(P)-dependent oxidoreductase [Oligoflexia bacterium]
MKIMVTGGAGYLGSIMVPELLKHGWEVVVVDNFLYRQTPLLDHCNNQNLTIVRGDVRNRDVVGKVIRDVDFIFPLACLTGAPICSQNPVDAQSVNYDAIKLLLELRSKNQKIIFPTTNSGYGIGQKDIFCTEATPLNPISLYGKLKADIEQALLDDGEVITLRLATVFGASPRMRFDLLVNDFVQRALVDSTVVLFESHFKRNYLHIRDVARAFVFALENFQSMKDQCYNVGLNDANLSKFELCTLIQEYVPKFVFLESEIGKDPDQRNYIVSNEKINAKGFFAKTSMSEGVQELIKGLQIIKRHNLSCSNI